MTIRFFTSCFIEQPNISVTLRQLKTISEFAPEALKLIGFGLMDFMYKQRLSVPDL